MAYYKYSEYLKTGAGALFDNTYSPGTTCPLSGIYRCENCGREHTCNAGDPLPEETHHQHPNYTRMIWRLVVASQSKAEI